ncbi:hypothetical protein RUM44_011359 [Polyplax serrata]|uniref:Uncharacterized protein n=1 Tax=Polyplax serrata TaxID=468196 RepID=A0ABR1APW1_POLSC
MSTSGEGAGPTAQGTPNASDGNVTIKVEGSPSSRQIAASVPASGPQSPAIKKTVPDGDCTRTTKGKRPLKLASFMQYFNLVPVLNEFK